MHKYLTEFIGTFFLVLTVCMMVISGQRRHSHRWPSACR
jgi:glycerol uptake facilitator-like aquaporin